MQRNIFSVLRRNIPMMVPKFMPKRTFMSSPRMLQQCGGSKVSPKIVKLQKQFQQNDGKPVFLKGGFMDGILYKLTWLLCLLGIIGDVWLWFGYILA